MSSQQEKIKPPKSSTQGRDYSKSKSITTKILAAISTLATSTPKVSSSMLATSIPKVSSSTSAISTPKVSSSHQLLVLKNQKLTQ